MGYKYAHNITVESEERCHSRVLHRFSITQASRTVTTTLKPIKAPEIRISVAPFLAGGTGAVEVAPVPELVAVVNVEIRLDRLEIALDCEAEMLDILDDAPDESDDATDEIDELIEEATELAPEETEAA